MLGTQWEVGTNASEYGGSLELRWFDRVQWKEYGFRSGGNVDVSRGVGISGVKQDGSGCQLSDPDLHLIYFGVYTQDSHFWRGWIDMSNWGGGLLWNDRSLVYDSGNWLTGPQEEVEAKKGAKKPTLGEMLAKTADPKYTFDLSQFPDPTRKAG